VKEIFLVFLSIVAILAGSLLIIENVSYWNAENIFWTVVGIILVAGGVTALWAKRRFAIR
jgi:hypothetical protein